MRPRAKYAVIYRHREEYPISVMCQFFGVDTTILFIGWADRKRMLVWRKRSVSSKIKVTELMDTGGCSSHWQRKEYTAIPKLCCES